MILEEAITKLFSESWKVGHLPKSKCRNCKGGLRLYEGRWYHVEMGGGKYYIPGGRIDYKTTETMYYDFKCQDCIADYKKNDKIGDLTVELRRQLKIGNHRYLKYGTSCSVVLTRKGIFFEDIC